jgi:PAS domain S-box-containing protein
MGTTKQALRYADNERPEQLRSHERATPTAMMATRPGPSPALMPLARVVAIVCIAFGVAGLTSWWWGEPLFPGFLRTWGVLKPNTAFCFVLAGLSLAGLVAQSRLESGGASNRLLVSMQPTAALLLLIFAGMTLLSHVLQLPNGIDKLLVPDNATPRLRMFPWRMSPISAVSFSVLALAMLPWSRRLTRVWLTLELLVLLTSVGAFIMVLGHAYKATTLYSLPGFSIVALHTALGLFALTVGVLTVHPRFRLASQIMTPDQAGAEMRRLLPAAILVPCIIGWALIQGEKHGWYDTPLGLAMFTAANMLAFSGLVWWNAQAVRRFEQGRRDLEGRLADILNSATDGILALDEDLNIRLFNPAAERIFGHSSRDVLGQPLDLLLPERHRQLRRSQVREYANSPAEQRRMGMLAGLMGVRANGEEFPIEASLSQVESSDNRLLTVILRDVTERLRTEQALRAHLRRVEAIAEMDRAILGMRSTREVAETGLHHLRRMVPCSCASVVVFDRNSSKPQLLAVNANEGCKFVPKAYSSTEYERAQQGNSSKHILINDLRTIEPRVDLFRHLQQAGAVSYVGFPLRGEQRLLGMLELVDSEAECFDEEQLQSARTIADQLAIALQQALLKEDIDRHTAMLERRVQERTQELEATNKELTSANRDLEDFTASAAHDLRAPLNAMAGNCGLLREFVEQIPGAEANYRMERIEAQIRRMNDVIDGMLGIAHITKVELTRRRINPNTVAVEVIQELQQQYPSHRVQYAVDCGEPICADPRLIRSLLMNLLSNAWKYTTRTKDPMVELKRLPGELEPTFVISDNGAGFDMNYAQHLFEPFRRMHTLTEFPGVGIGLATAARIVQRYGGRIWAESVVGKGATFYFTLPQAMASADDVGAPSETSGAA